MKRDTIIIGGIEVIVGTPAECEASTFVICGPRSFFPDDVHTSCALCRTPIVHRPYAPVMPLKICLECMVRVAGSGR